MKEKTKAKKNNKNIIIAGTVAVVTIACVASYFVFFKPTGKSDNPVVAHIDGEPYYADQAKERLAMLMNAKEVKDFDKIPKSSLEVVVKGEAAKRELAKLARKDGTDRDKEVLKRVKAFEEQTIQDAFLTKAVEQNINDEKIKKNYEEVKKNFEGQKNIHIKHILVKTEQEANNIIKSVVDDKKSFEKLAAEFSIDKDSSAKGGDIGATLSGRLDPNIAKAALSLHRGEISAPVKSQFGWHVIKLESSENVSLAPFEQIKDAIRQDLIAQEKRAYIEKILKDVKISVEGGVEDNADKKKSNS